MSGVKEVRQIDRSHVHWVAQVGREAREWDAEIVEQVPDRLIAWRSTSGTPNSGRVRFFAHRPRNAAHRRDRARAGRREGENRLVNRGGRGSGGKKGPRAFSRAH